MPRLVRWLAPLVVWAACRDGSQPRDGQLADCRPPDRRVLEPTPLDRGVDAPKIDPACLKNGCLRARTLIGTYSRATVESYLAPGLTITNGYSVHWVVFYTDGRTSTAMITVPHDPDTPPAGGFHVVGNNHGTVGLEDPCAPSGSVAGTGLAGLFGARGTIGVAVDYPGLGTPGLHPYLVARVEGTSALDGLRAAQQLAALLGKPVSGRCALVGLSQGGHATLSAAALQASYAPELDIRAFGVEGPASVWESHWSSGAGVAGAHLAYHAMLVYAWAAHYGWQGKPLWTDAVAATIDETMTKHCLTSEGGATIGSQLPTDPAQLFQPALLSEYTTRTWKDYIALHDGFVANAVKPWAQRAPLRIYQGEADQTVLETQTREMVEALRAAGMTVDYQVVPGADHATVAFGYLATKQQRTEESIAWVRQLLDGT